jgi:hypothetical protein
MDLTSAKVDIHKTWQGDDIRDTTNRLSKDTVGQSERIEERESPL